MTQRPTPKKSIPPPPAEPWKTARFSFSGKSAEKESKKRDGRIEEGLEAIYLKDKGAPMDDLAKISRRNRHRLLRFFGFAAAILVLLSALAWAGLLFFQPEQTSGSGLVIAIDGRESVTLGQETTYVIEWSNQDFQPASDAEIRVSYPPEFQGASFFPEPTGRDPLVWHLGRLAPGARGRITVHGVFLGELGGAGAIQAIGTYRPNDSEQSADTVVAKAVRYTESVFDSALEAPAKVTSGEAFDVSFVIFNRSDRDREGLLARIKLPQGFVPSASSSSLPGNLDEQRWWTAGLETLPSNTTTTVRLAGAFISGTSGEQAFTAEVGSRDVRGGFLALQRAELLLPVIAGDLGLHFVVNGSDLDRTIAPGEPLRLAIGFENTSPEELGDVSFVLSFESVVDGKSSTGTTLLDWKSLEDRTGGVSSTRGRIQTIRYDSDVLAMLGSLAPQQRGTVELALPTLGAPSGTRDARIRISLEGAFATVGKDTVNRVIRTKPVELRYRTDADFAVEARYFTEEGAPVGSGPLPPQAGKTTSYRVTWRIEKTLHELSDVAVTALLPNIAAWSDKGLSDAGTVAYDPQTRLVSWTLNRMPPDVQSLEASFEVQVTPDETDIGRFAAVLRESGLVATDVDTGESVRINKPPLTTDLQNDEGAAGKGVVRKSE